MSKCESCLESRQIEIRDRATSSSEGGDSLAKTFERKRQYIWVPFLDPEDIKILSLGPSGTLVKGQGSPELISDYGAQRARL
jgi:hypothetical protein